MENIKIIREERINISFFQVDEFLTQTFDNENFTFIKSLLQSNNYIIALNKFLTDGRLFIIQKRFPFNRLSTYGYLCITNETLGRIEQILNNTDLPQRYRLGREMVKEILQSITFFSEEGI